MATAEIQWEIPNPGPALLNLPGRSSSKFQLSFKVVGIVGVSQLRIQSWNSWALWVSKCHMKWEFSLNFHPPHGSTLSFPAFSPCWVQTWNCRQGNPWNPQGDLTPGCYKHQPGFSLALCDERNVPLWVGWCNSLSGSLCEMLLSEKMQIRDKMSREELFLLHEGWGWRIKCFKVIQKGLFPHAWTILMRMLSGKDNKQLFKILKPTAQFLHPIHWKNLSPPSPSKLFWHLQHLLVDNGLKSPKPEPGHEEPPGTSSSNYSDSFPHHLWLLPEQGEILL